MNTIGIVFLATVARVTVLGLFGVALAFFVRKRGHSAVVLATISTLSCLVVVTALSLSPWPRLWSFDLGSLSSNQMAKTSETSRPVIPTINPENLVDSPLKTSNAGTTLADFANLFREELRSQRIFEEPAARALWRWPAWVAAILISTVLVGLLRLALALRAVALLRRRSTPLADVALRDEVDLLRAEMGCVQRVELRETTDLTTPATVGWRHPVLLVPADWNSWLPDERRAALAHELAHVQGGDYLSGLWAQACLSFHLYHPIAHWLVARFRLEQELAADAAAAKLSGGSRPYLEALARLALRRTGPLEGSTGAGLWPARAFLPTRGMFMRRMEMLRDTSSSTQNAKPLRPLGRALTVATIAIAALGVAGLRGPLQAQQDGKKFEVNVKFDVTNSRETADIFNLSHAPANTVVAIVGKPAAILSRPEFKPIRDIFKPDEKSTIGAFNMPIEEIESFQVLFLKGAAPGQPLGMQPLVLIRATKPQDWRVVAGKFIGDPETVAFEGLSYVRTKQQPVGAVLLTTNDRTAMMGNEEDIKSLILASKQRPIAHPWDKAWSKVEKGQLAMALDPAPFASMLVSMKNNPPGTPQSTLATQLTLFAPMVEKATGYAVGVNADKGVSVHKVATTPDEASAKTIEENVLALITLGKNAMNAIRQFPKAPANMQGEAQLIGVVLDFADPLLASAKSSRPDNSTVEFRATTDKDISTAVNPLIPALIAMRASSLRMQSMNNMKRIGLAMHNYRADKNQFPASALRDKPGKIPYSWRVAILPYIEQHQDLYNAYDFSKPWDGPKNKKLLERMPAIYRHPLDDPKSINTSYFVPVGDTTLFPPDGTKIGFQDVTDGTSNTIMTVEAKRPIPWTKPEDIPIFIDQAKPDWTPPELDGFNPGGFLAGMADGSVRAFPMVLNKIVFRALLTRAGGEVISFDALDKPRPPTNIGQPRSMMERIPTPAPDRR